VAGDESTPQHTTERRRTRRSTGTQQRNSGAAQTQAARACFSAAFSLSLIQLWDTASPYASTQSRSELKRVWDWADRERYSFHNAKQREECEKQSERVREKQMR
jgi:hypothetical protein